MSLATPAASASSSVALSAEQDQNQVIHDGESNHRHGKAPRQRLQAPFDLVFAVFEPLATQERPPHAAGNAVTITTYIHVHQLTSRRRHRPACLEPSPLQPLVYQNRGHVNQQCLSFSFARCSHIPAHRRPHYPPTERLAIVALRAARVERVLVDDTALVGLLSDRYPLFGLSTPCVTRLVTFVKTADVNTASQRSKSGGERKAPPSSADAA